MNTKSLNEGFERERERRGEDILYGFTHYNFTYVKGPINKNKVRGLR